MAEESTTRPALFATLSFFIEDEVLRKCGKKLGLPQWDPPTRKKLQATLQSPGRGDLSDAIDPMFNDIAVRDRNSRLDEFLISAPKELSHDEIRLTIPQHVDWTTEGKQFKVQFADPVSRPIACRMFWYVHGNGAISYHASFEIPSPVNSDKEPSTGHEQNTFETLYFLAVFQKLMFPKELKRNPPSMRDGFLTGIKLLDRECVRRSSGTDQFLPPDLTFSGYLRQRFNAHFDDLVAWIRSRVDGRGFNGEPAHVKQDAWDLLVKKEDFIEVPGLELQQARGLFLFRDKNLFDCLRERKEHLGHHTYKPVLPQPEGGVYVIKESLLTEIPQTHRVEYYFLSGFFQNIIDFLNQDASEIWDGTDAIYPTDPEEKDPFFFRYSNARCLYQVVKSSRSLDIGREFIGTCPYIFLVHLTSLYNEFLIRGYEAKVNKALSALDPGDGGHSGSSLQELFKKSITEPRLPEEWIRKMEIMIAKFHAFRHQAFTGYTRHLYGNIFRYDTERDVFKSVSRIRAVQKRLADCDKIVTGIDQTVTDLRANVRHQAELRRQNSNDTLSVFVAAIGVFSVLAVLLQAHDLYERKVGEEVSSLVHLVALGAMWSAYIVLVGIVVVLVGTVAWLIDPYLGRPLSKSITWIKTRCFRRKVLAHKSGEGLIFAGAIVSSIGLCLTLRVPDRARWTVGKIRHVVEFFKVKVESWPPLKVGIGLLLMGIIVILIGLLLIRRPTSTASRNDAP